MEDVLHMLRVRIHIVYEHEHIVSFRAISSQIQTQSNCCATCDKFHVWIQVAELGEIEDDSSCN